MAVGSPAERNKDGGTACGGDFRRGDGSCPANNHIGPGEAFRHVVEEGNDFSVDFAPCISGAHSIIVTLASLMDDSEFILSHREPVHRVHKRPIDRQCSLTATGDEQAERFRE